MDTIFTGIDHDELQKVLASGVDQGGNPIETFVDHDGGWPMRCCLTDSKPGERVAIIAWSPFDWQGPYAEIGPLVVHAEGCPTPGELDTLPAELDARAMTLRPYGADHRIAYHRVRHVPTGNSVAEHVRDILDHGDVDFVHGRNMTGGCYAFTATRA